MDYRETLRAGGIAFIKAELRTALTLVSIAETARDLDKIKRNWENARKALVCARRFMGETYMSQTESAELLEQLQELEIRLRTLSERIHSGSNPAGRHPHPPLQS